MSQSVYPPQQPWTPPSPSAPPQQQWSPPQQQSAPPAQTTYPPQQQQWSPPPQQPGPQAGYPPQAPQPAPQSGYPQPQAQPGKQIIQLTDKGACQITVPFGNRPDGRPRVARASYAHIGRPKVIEAGKPAKYTVSLILDAEDCVDLWNAIVLVAQAEHGADAYARLQAGNLHSPLRNADDPRNGRPNDAAYRGKWFINLSSENPPHVFGWDTNPIDPNKIYSGCYVRASIGLFRIPAKWGKRGVGAAVNALQFCGEGEPLSDAQNPQRHIDAFRAAGPVQPVTGGDGSGYGWNSGPNNPPPGAFGAPPPQQFGGPPAGQPAQAWQPPGPQQPPQPGYPGQPPAGWGAPPAR